MIEELPRIKFPEKKDQLSEKKSRQKRGYAWKVTSKRGAKISNLQNRRNPDSPMKPIR